jgi:hypothetical protein
VRGGIGHRASRRVEPVRAQATIEDPAPVHATILPGFADTERPRTVASPPSTPAALGTPDAVARPGRGCWNRRAERTDRLARKAAKRMKIDYTPEEERGRVGERVVFAAWAGVISLGLIVMIVIPLTEFGS